MVMTLELAEAMLKKHRRDLVLWQWAARLAVTPAPEGKLRHVWLYYFDAKSHQDDIRALGAIDSFEVMSGNHGRNCTFVLVYPGDPPRPEVAI